MTKRNIVFSILLMLIGLPVFSQNNVPVITNLQAVADTVFHKLTVTYDVADTENDNLEIFLNASVDGGVNFMFDADSAQGDIGYPVTPGTGKTIIWYYPDSLTQFIASFKAKLTANDRYVPNIQQIVDMVDTNNLKQNLQFIAGIRHRATGAAHLQFVRDTVLNIFSLYGMQTRQHDIPSGSYTGKNLVGKKTGLVNNNKTYIVSGHYDTVNDSPGADDNGSALAGMLEIARIITQFNLRNTVQFIGFDLEEAGLQGSIKYAENDIQPDEKIACLINMDMIGYYTDVPNTQTVPNGFSLVFPDLYAELVANQFRGNFILSTANNYSNEMNLLFDTLAAQYVPSLLVGPIEVPGNGELIPDARRSDHAAFWDAGYMALHISDGAETRNPNYHSPTDVPDSVNYTFMGNVTKAVLATLVSLVQPIHAGMEEVQVQPDPHSSVWEIGKTRCTISVSPNPADGKISINTANCGNEPMNVKIISAEGKIIFTEKIKAQEKLQFNLADVHASSYYIVEVTAANRAYTKKVWIK
jgi:hypothetical protein